MSAEPAPDNQQAGEQEDPGWPWSFVLLVVAGALYLVFRLVDFIVNVVN